MAADTEAPPQSAGPAMTWTDLVSRYPELAVSITTFNEWKEWQKNHPSVPMYMWEFREALEKPPTQRTERNEPEEGGRPHHPLHFQGEDKLGKYLDNQNPEIDIEKVKERAVENMIKQPKHNFERVEKLMLDDWLRAHPDKTAESDETKRYTTPQKKGELSQQQKDAREFFKHSYENEIKEELQKIHTNPSNDPHYQEMNAQAGEYAQNLIERAKRDSSFAWSLGKSSVITTHDEEEIKDKVHQRFVKSFALQNPQKAATYARYDPAMHEELKRQRKEGERKKEEEEKGEESHPLRSFVQRRITNRILKNVRVSNIEPIEPAFPSAEPELIPPSSTYIDTVNNWVGRLQNTPFGRGLFGPTGFPEAGGLGAGGAEGIGAAAAGAEAGAAGAAAGAEGLAGAAAGAGGLGAAGGAAAGGVAVGGGGVVLIILLIILLILLILFVFWLVFAYGGNSLSGNNPNGPYSDITGLTISLDGPPQASYQQTITYTITAAYTGKEDVIINDPVPQGTSFVSATCNFTNADNTISWRLKDNLLCGGLGLVDVLGNPIGGRSYTFSLTVQINQDNTVITNQAFGTLAGEPISNTGSSTPANNDTCSNKYSLTNPLGNFGDPSCSFSRDSAASVIQQQDSRFASRWINIIVPCESNWNPNSYNAHAVDPAGAWGLFQMGRGKNGSLDHGDVNWTQQISNAISYNSSIGNSFSYWQCR